VTDRLMTRTPWILAVLLALLTACGSGDKSDAAPTDVPASSASTQPTAPSSPPTTVEMRGAAATSPACKLLTLEQVTTISGLHVTAMSGLPTQGVAPSAVSESCTWFLDSTEIQASLVVQFGLFAHPPADLLAYYPTVVEQGIAKHIAGLGDYSKVESAVLDTIDGRAEIHSTLRLHYPEATPEDQAKNVALMRLVIAGISQ
jgi:hypothetical protein